MTTIEIPVPDFRIEGRYVFSYNSSKPWEPGATEKWEFQFIVGDHVVTSRQVTLPVYDYENSQRDRERDNFCEYVAERLSTLFPKEES